MAGAGAAGGGAGGQGDARPRDGHQHEDSTQGGAPLYTRGNTGRIILAIFFQILTLFFRLPTRSSSDDSEAVFVVIEIVMRMRIIIVPCEALPQPYYYYPNMFQSPNVTEHDDRAKRGCWAAPQALSRVPEEGGQEEGEAFPHQPRGGGEG